MKGFFKFMSSAAGRWARAIAGIILIVLGLFVLEGTTAWIVGIIGIVPLAAGLFDWCIFAPLFRLPFGGSELREATKE